MGLAGSSMYVPWQSADAYCRAVCTHLPAGGLSGGAAFARRGLPVEICSRFMKTAHEGVAPAALPGLAGGGWLSAAPQPAQGRDGARFLAPRPPVRTALNAFDQAGNAVTPAFLSRVDADQVTTVHFAVFCLCPGSSR